MSSLNIVTARQGVLAQLAKIKEATIGTDPVTPTPMILPLSGDTTVGHSQPLTAAKIGDGRRTSKGSFKGLIDVSGDVPMSLDFRVAGIDMDCHFGHDVYSRVASLHRWNGFGTPISFQLEKRFTQTTALFHRLRALYSTLIKFTPAASGQSMYTVTHLGAGDLQTTAIGGTDVDNAPFTANNYFNGYLNLQGVGLADVTEFSLSLDNKITRKDALYHAGAAAAFNFGIPTIEGDLGRIFSVDSGDTFFDLALNETVAGLECAYFDLPPDVGPTQWLRFQIPAVKFALKDPDIQIEDANEQTQHFISQVPTADLAAEVIASVTKAFGVTVTVPAASHFYIKVDGGSVTDVDLTAIAGSKTWEQIVAAINADSGFNTKAIADVWNRHIRFRSLSTVAGTSKLQNQAGTGNINALIGITDTTTVWSGRAASMLYTDLFNTVASDY